VVLWFYYEGNDLADLEAEKTAPLLMHYLHRGFNQNLFMHQHRIDSALAEFVETSRKENSPVRVKIREIKDLMVNTERVPTLIRGIVRLQQLRQRLGLVHGEPSSGETKRRPIPDVEEPLSPVMDLFQRTLSEARDRVHEWNGKLYFVYLPEWRRYTLSDGNPERDRVIKVAESLGLPVIDIHQVFAAQGDPASLFPFRLQGHYTEEGHRIVADYVLQSVSLEQ
jgi:hypothetical protein